MSVIRTPNIFTYPGNDCYCRDTIIPTESGNLKDTGTCLKEHQASALCKYSEQSPPHATTLMLRVVNGSLLYYRGPVLVQDIYDKWFKLNVIHDVDAAKVKVYINGCLIFEADGRGGTSHAFKCGVYAQNDDSYYMESRWKDIKVLRKCD